MNNNKKLHKIIICISIVVASGMMQGASAQDPPILQDESSFIFWNENLTSGFSGSNLDELIEVLNVPDPGGDPDVPIDGGLSLLLAAGAGYGVKALRKRKNKTQNN